MSLLSAFQSFCIQVWLAIMASGGGKGASAPGGTVQRAAFGGAKYGILKFGCFWLIGVCIAGRIRRVH